MSRTRKPSTPKCPSSASRYGWPGWRSAASVWPRITFDGTSHSATGPLQRATRLGVFAPGQGQRVRAEQGLAAAGGNADAHIGHTAAGTGEALAEIGWNLRRRHLLRRQRGAEGGVEPGLVLRVAGAGEEIAERVESLLLIVFEDQAHGRLSVSGRECRRESA